MNEFTVILIILITVLFLLFVIRIITLCWHNFTLSRLIKILEQQQADSNSSEYSNYTINNSTAYNPYCADCLSNYVTIAPPLITYSFTYSYAYYGFLLFLLIAAIVCIKMGISRRKELERRAAAQRGTARQQVESVYVQATSDNNNNNNSTAAKEVDLPPTYEDVIQSCMLTKQQQQQSAENAPIENATGMTTNSSTNTISETSSTLTIETELSNSKQASDEHVNNPTNRH